MQLRVVTYNIHRAIGMDRRFRLDRIESILAHHNADLLLLQEVDVGAPRSRRLDLARELAERLGYPHHAVGLNVQLRQGMYGNATLSRLPIRRQRNIDLTIGTRKARGCLFTELDAPVDSLGPLAVFNLHLGLSFKERPLQVGTLVRSPEFRQLDEDQPCLVGGDFNDWLSRLSPIFTEGLCFGCATNHGAGRQTPIATYPSFSPTAGLDKIFWRGRLSLEACKRCRLRAAKVASDHLPVVADFRLLS
ncbi:MAG: endonuclease/exonuclease/phosphatase family protein [Thermodesulfobacteriota bacterium]